MSNFSAIGLVFMLGLANVFIWHLMDRRIWNRFESVATGVNQNLPMSMEHRHLYLHVRWLGEVMVLVATMSGAALGFVLLALNTNAEHVRLFAYVAAFFTGGVAVSYLLQAPLLYSRLRSELREAERR